MEAFHGLINISKAFIMLTGKTRGIPSSIKTTIKLRMPLSPWLGGSVGWIVIPVYQNVLGSIPSLGVYRRQPIRSMFLFYISLPLPLSLESINISLGKDLKKKKKRMPPLSL